MTVYQILGIIFESVILPLIIVGAGYLVSYIDAKKEQIKIQIKSDMSKKYLDMLDETITKSVLSTTQTYVDALKKEGKFDIEAQKKAFEITYTKIKSSLTEEAEKYLNNIVHDLNEYITNRIEAEVIINKKG